MNEANASNLRWRVRNRQTGQFLPGEFFRLTDAYGSVRMSGNAMWKYLFILA